MLKIGLSRISPMASARTGRDGALRRPAPRTSGATRAKPYASALLTQRRWYAATTAQRTVVHQGGLLRQQIEEVDPCIGQPPAVALARDEFAARVFGVFFRIRRK